MKGSFYVNKKNIYQILNLQILLQSLSKKTIKISKISNFHTIWSLNITEKIWYLFFRPESIDWSGSAFYSQIRFIYFSRCGSESGFFLSKGQFQPAHDWKLNDCECEWVFFFSGKRHEYSGLWRWMLQFQATHGTCIRW